jgi:hypothetical protein
VSIEGAKSKWSWWIVYAGTLLILYAALTSCDPPPAGAASDPSAPETGPITVKITNTNPAVATAIARVVESAETDTLDQDKLSFSICLQGQRISVWAPGYIVATLTCNGSSPIEYSISLEPVNAADNPTYLWVGADVHSGSLQHCSSCHTNPSLGLNEFAEWNQDGHARAFANPYF